MKNRKSTPLWLYFSIIIFIIFTFTAILMFGIAMILYHNGFFPTNKGLPVFPILFLFSMSIFIGTIISIFVSKIILKPIINFTMGVEKVSNGDFNISLNEKSQIKELQNLIHNFNRMTHELASIETLRNDFVTNVSHEFKTPISSIEGYATLLQDNSLSDSERLEYCDMIMESTKQLGTLTGNILLLSKLENQNVVANPQEFRLDEQIRQAILLLESKWTSKNIDLEILLDKITYTGNESLLMQVWMNLIDNAIKFTSEYGTIEIVLRKKDTSILFQIRDSGCGISSDAVTHIFDKFYQGDLARKTEGNGLGLALVKVILNFSGGSISVESKEGYGTTFYVTL